ncbi:phospholipase D-like domain-containing protein [Burkholderia ambifaria]|uniref:Phospholipase D/Transphosphatidylase n=1 Tax=Burkholderia ambifaria MEX-5 TaxID=396597 RepID=B1TD36_9BURK|nr:phospholipase D-like domain-containing protein [Burkholderia ambifaria]EDT38527.1 phospholipase D/Transphosphatidylase [Burkholderia ambifaria MEX-5]
MSDTNTQNKSKAPVDVSTRQSVASAQWFLEKNETYYAPPYEKNNLDVFICGEDAFKQIAADLKAAKHSVEIICWGFDPGMELIRNGSVWPRGDTWGGLLRDVAAGKFNNGKPVQVRLLSWYGFIGSLGSNNMPGHSSGRLNYEEKMAMMVGAGGGIYLPTGKPPQPQTPQERREDFNARWYDDAFAGRLANLSIRTRDGSSKAVHESLVGEPGKRDFTEVLGLEKVATDHQKTILIDYEYEGGAHAVGYVMGLNSVTDYWDTQQHLFNDPRRGESWEGANDVQPGLKPYQDYTSRIRGEALVAVSKNFIDAWNRAKGKGANVSRTHDFKKVPPGLTQNLGAPCQRAQVVRTQPEEKDKSIKALYEQATSFARSYIYVENQYFQYTEWPKKLKELRTQFLSCSQAAGKSPVDIPNLHVLVVIPTPERAQMVPRTHDTVKVLGHGTSMPNQDKAIEDELARNRQQQATWDAYVKRQKASGARIDPDLYPAPLSPVAQSAKDLGDKASLSKSLDQMGIRALIGSLWTFDSNWRSSTLSTETAKQQARWDEYVKKQQAKGELPDPDLAPMLPLPTQSIAARYREIYIHSKLLLIDDSFFTLGSANLNLRSMAVDAEINIGTDDPAKSEDLRKRVWKLHTGNAADCNPASLTPKAMAKTFINWVQLLRANEIARKKGDAPTGFLHPFHDERETGVRLS